MKDTVQSGFEVPAFNSHAEFLRNSPYAEFNPEHRLGGSFGVSLIDAEQPPFDLVDAAVPELVFCSLRTSGCTITLDLGDGPVVDQSAAAESITVYPAMNESRSTVSKAHRITVMALPVSSAIRLLDESGIRHNPFSTYYERLQNVPTATRLLDAMWHASDRMGSSASLLLDGLTLQFLSVMADESSLSPLAGCAREDLRIRRAIDYLDSHLGEALTVAELATVATMSASHFARSFKATTGQSVWSYVQRRRCEKAHELLTTTALPIVQVADVCGFANQSHLNRSIKQAFGVTPAVLRLG